MATFDDSRLAEHPAKAFPYDGVGRSMPRNVGWEGQQAAYSAQKKIHALKTTL